MNDESVTGQTDHSLDVNNGDSSAPVLQLSKNQQKKRRRQEAARQKHLAKKAEEKAARKASQQKKLAEREQHIAQMTEEERQAWDQQTQGKRQVSLRSPATHMPLAPYDDSPLAPGAAENLADTVTASPSDVYFAYMAPYHIFRMLQMSQAVLDNMQARKQAEMDRKEKLQRALDSGQRIIIDLDFADKMTGAELRSVCKQLAYSYSANTRAAQPGHLILTSYQASLLPSEGLRWKGTPLGKQEL